MDFLLDLSLFIVLFPLSFTSSHSTSSSNTTLAKRGKKLGASEEVVQMNGMSFSPIWHTCHKFKYNRLCLGKAFSFPCCTKPLWSLIISISFDMPKKVKHISLICENPNLESNWSRLCWNVDSIAGAAGKTLNTLINSNICCWLPVALKGS